MDVERLQSLEMKMDTRLSRIEEQNTQIMLALQKKKKGVFFVSLPIRSLLFIQSVREKINNLGYRPGPTQTDLYSHRSRLEA